jgi:FAD/FMN-containing dehydrogenase
VTERSWWGWGTTARALTDDECVAAAAALKTAAMEVLRRLGATITHHHAVGRDPRAC